MMPVMDLWKVDDKAWMKQRREDWKILEAGPLKEASKKEIAKYKKFFLSGADVGYIGDWFRYLMIPFTNQAEAREAFFSSYFRHPSSKERILLEFIFRGADWGRDLPWIRRSMISFVEGVLGYAYESPHCVDSGGHKVRASDAHWFCQCYSNHTIFLLKREYEYSGVIECFDYFYSALQTGFSPQPVERPKLLEMVELAQKYLSSDDSNELLRLFSQQILSRKDEMLKVYRSWSE